MDSGGSTNERATVAAPGADFVNLEISDTRTWRGMPVGVLHNLFALYGLYCSTYVLALVTVPYLSRVLGPFQWGLLAAVQSFGGYLLITVEFGFNFSGTREVARLRHDRAALRDTFAGVFGAKIALCLAAVLLSMVLVHWLRLFAIMRSCFGPAYTGRPLRARA